jgi:hypothetical protein
MRPVNDPNPVVKYPDYLLAYDPTGPLFSQPNPTANSIYEVTYGRHSMLFGTYFLPYVGQNVEPWKQDGATAISVPLTTDPFINGPGGKPQCQRNKYDYFLWNCTTDTLTGVLTAPNFCNTGTGVIFNSCEGCYALLQDNSGAPILYDEAAFLTINWFLGNASPYNQITKSWSCSIEWLSDPRSDALIGGIRYKIMLLGANHTF